jgi:uracil-DNA glycosylase family 4
LRGANATGRPFTGDWAGELLYPTLLKFGFAAGNYKGIAEDGVILQDARITNAVRCVPPANRPLGPETKACRSFLEREIAAMENLQCIVTLGTVSHGATLGALGIKKSLAPFGHGAVYDAQDGAVRLISSYHCSRYNTNTRRLSVEMFEAIFKAARDYLEH